MQQRAGRGDQDAVVAEHGGGPPRGRDGFFQVRLPDVASVDEPQREGDALAELGEDVLEVGAPAGEVDVQALHGHRERGLRVLAQVAEVDGGEDLEPRHCRNEPGVGAPERGALLVVERETEGGLVQLHPLRARLGQPLEDVLVDVHEPFQQQKRIERRVVRLGEQQVSDRAHEDGPRLDAELLRL